MKSTNDVLEHHGIKGQRWGIIRRRPPGGNVGDAHTPQKSKAQEQKEAADRHSEVLNRANKSGTKSLSNQELKDLTERLNLELNLNSTLGRVNAANRPPPSKKKAAAQWVGKTLREVGQQQAKAVLSDVATHKRKQLLKSYGINPGKDEKDKNKNNDKKD